MLKLIKSTKPVFGLVITTLLLFACQTAYYNAMEKFGFHKRDLLVDYIMQARDSQKEAKEQFKSSLEKFSAVVNFDGGELQQKYEQLNADLEQSESSAEDVRKRIESVESVAEALFKEWETELQQYSNEKMRRVSQQKLTSTQQQYAKLISTMKRAEQKIEPVLVIFRDQVRFLKHSLNAQAVASLKGELILVESNVDSLIKEIEISIREADAFIGKMNQE